jgi:hypothetical protein
MYLDSFRANTLFLLGFPYFYHAIGDLAPKVLLNRDKNNSYGRVKINFKLLLFYYK